MTPFIKFIYVAGNDLPAFTSILNDDVEIQNTYNNYSPVEKSVFLVRQAFLSTYLETLSTATKNPSFTAFKEWLVKNVSLQKAANEMRDDGYDKLLADENLSLAAMLLNTSGETMWELLDAESLGKCMTSFKNIPGAVKADAYLPFIAFMKTFYRPDIELPPEVIVNNAQLLVPFTITGRCVTLCASQPFVYRQDLSTYKEAGVTLRSPLFRYLNSFEKGFPTLESIIALVSQFAIGNEHPGYLELLKDMEFQSLGLATPRIKSLQQSNIPEFKLQYHIEEIFASDMVSMIAYQRIINDLKIDNLALLRTVVGSVSGPPVITNLLNNATSVAEAPTPEVAAAIESWNASLGNSLKKKTLTFDVEVSLTAAKEGLESAMESSLFLAQDGTVGPALISKPTVAGPFDPEESEDAEGDTSDEEPIESEDDETTEDDDDSTEEPTETDPEAPDEDPDSESEEEGDPSEEESENPDDTHTLVKNRIQDILGFELKLEKKATAESEIYKGLIRSHINQVLNSDHDLSPDEVGILRRLKLYWLNLLDIEIVTQILEKVFAGKNINIT